MKTVILHGDYTARSYVRLQQLVNQARNLGQEIIEINVEAEKSLRSKLSSQSLFGKERLVVLYNSDKLQKKHLDELKTVVSGSEGTLLIYADKEIKKTLLGAFPKNVGIETFKLPKHIFSFLDSFYPKNAKACLLFLHETKKTETPEFIIALLGRHLRDLYWVKTAGSPPYAPWRISKLKSQSAKFSEHALMELISLLAELDVKSKTAKADGLASLDLLIVTRLE